MKLKMDRETQRKTERENERAVENSAQLLLPLAYTAAAIATLGRNYIKDPVPQLP